MQPLKACVKKKLSEAKALKLISQAQFKSRVRNNFNRMEKRHYFCETCKAWHITSKKS